MALASTTTTAMESASSKTDVIFKALKWLDEKLKLSVLVDLPGIFQEIVEKLLQYPIVSAAIITWLKCDISIFQRNLNAAGRVPIHFILLEEIALVQPMQQAMVFSFLQEIYEYSSGDVAVLVSIQFKKICIDRFIFLIRCGFVGPVIDYFCLKKNSMDESLLVYFLNELHEIIDADADANNFNYNIISPQLTQLISNLSETSQSKLSIVLNLKKKE